MHISSAAVPKFYGKIERCWGEKKKIAEIHMSHFESRGSIIYLLVWTAKELKKLRS